GSGGAGRDPHPGRPLSGRAASRTRRSAPAAGGRLNKPALIVMAEREALLTCLREQWRATGLSTAPVDEATAREAVRSLYRASGEPPPKAVLVLPSPLACLLARGILLALLAPTVCSDVRSTWKQSHPPHIRDQLGNEYWGALWGRVWEQLRDQIGSEMWRPLADLQEDPFHRVPTEPISKRIGGRLRHALCT